MDKHMEQDLFYMLMGNNIESLILIAFAYLYYAFNGKFKTTDLPVYKFLSLGFGFTALSILIPMSIVYFGEDFYGSGLEDIIISAENISHLVTKILSIIFFIVAVKKVT